MAMTLAQAVGGVCAGVLDPRTSYVLHGEHGLIIWRGERHTQSTSRGALGRVGLRARRPDRVRAGRRARRVRQMLGGEGDVPSRLACYDKDYGVGTKPTIPPPEVEVQMPVISEPLSISGSARSGGETAGAPPPMMGRIPAPHDMSADDELPPLGRGGGGGGGDGSETPRGAPPPMSERLGGLGLTKLAPTPAADEPPPSHRGPPPPRSFADLPRGGDELHPTPRGRRNGPEPEPEEDSRRVKKPREDDEAMGGAGGAVGQASRRRRAVTRRCTPSETGTRSRCSRRPQPQCAPAICCSTRLVPPASWSCDRRRLAAVRGARLGHHRLRQGGVE